MGLETWELVTLDIVKLLSSVYCNLFAKMDDIAILAQRPSTALHCEPLIQFLTLW